MSAAAGALAEVLRQARERGLLGPGPIERHVEHARAFAAVLEACAGTVVDLGSGAGVPGLVLAQVRPDLHLVLVEAGERRCRFLTGALGQLDLEGRVEVRHERAETAGRGPWRGRVDAVVARSFGTPAVVAECAAPLLRVGGLLVVSEPPTSEAGSPRWPTAGLERLGLATAGRREVPFHFQLLRQQTVCPARYPRPVGRPAKRPLF